MNPCTSLNRKRTARPIFTAGIDPLSRRRIAVRLLTERTPIKSPKVRSLSVVISKPFSFSPRLMRRVYLNCKANMEGKMEGPEGIIHVRGLVVFMPCIDRLFFRVSLNAE